MHGTSIRVCAVSAAAWLAIACDGATASEATTDAVVLPGCLALQFETAGSLSDRPAGIASDCEAGEDRPLSGTLHRTEATECSGANVGECVSDSDCAADEACLCASGFAIEDGAVDLVLTTRCYRAGCRIDADCGEHLCAAETPCGYVEQLRCHSDEDVCTLDSDCPGTPGAEICVWGADEARWVCAAAVVCE